MAILNKKQMTEEDIKFNYITPAIIAKGWKNYLTMETKITDGRISLVLLSILLFSWKTTPD